MYLSAIWRYPVKSMRGERLTRAALGLNGIEGDRVFCVVDARGKVTTARTYPALLGHAAVLGGNGEPLIDGEPWTSDGPGAAVQAIVGPGARLVRSEGQKRFDVLPLLVATDGAIAAFGYDGRRLRPNLVIGGVNGLDERRWAGRSLRIGEAIVRIADLRDRCVMTTFDPDSLVQNRQVLLAIVQRFDGKLALNAGVGRGGIISEGDPVELMPSRAASEAGGL